MDDSRKTLMFRLAACVVVGLIVALLLASCNSAPTVHKTALDYVSGSTCLNQRATAVISLVSWMDRETGSEVLYAEGVKNIYASIQLEDAKPDEQEDTAMLAMLEAQLLGIVVRRAAEVYRIKKGDADGSLLEAAKDVVNNLGDYGFDVVHWRTAVAATPC